jgi:hypothetical protein
MSVNVRVYRVFSSEIEPLRRATEEELHRLLFGPEGGTGWDVDPERMLDLEKAWAAVNFVLAGSDRQSPVSFLASKSVGEEIDYEFTYGPGRLLEPILVKQIAGSIAALSPATVEARLSDALAMNELYPFSIRNYGSKDRAWIYESVSELRTFVERAAKLDCALLVGSS